jgi:hypothetical protein
MPSTDATAPSPRVTPPAQRPRSLAYAEKQIKTGGDFANMMSALMTDLIEGRVTPQIGNATCNAGGKLLKVIEMTHKYGVRVANARNKTLVLASGGRA